MMLLNGDAISWLVMQDFVKFLWNDMEMLKSSRAHWTLIPSAAADSSAQQNSDSIDASQNGKRHTYGLRIAYPEEAKEICCKGLVVGSCPQADIQLDVPQVTLIILLWRSDCPRSASCGGMLHIVPVLNLVLTPLVSSASSSEVCCASHEGEGQARACAAAA